MTRPMRYCSEALEGILDQEREAVGMRLVAPVLSGRKVRIRINRLLLECLLDADFSGWGLFEISGRGKARLLREAEIWEKEAYLKVFSLFSLVLFHRDGQGIWWGRDFRRGKFVPLFLVEGHLIFDTVLASFDGANYWYVSLDSRGDLKKAEALRIALESRVQPQQLRGFLQQRNLALTRRERDLYEMTVALKQGEEERHKDIHTRSIEKALRIGDAELLGCAEVDNGYRVQWRKGGMILTSVVDRNLSVITAGVCLSGKEKQQDLTSLASLMAERGDRWIGYGGA